MITVLVTTNEELGGESFEDLAAVLRESGYDPVAVPGTAVSKGGWWELAMEITGEVSTATALASQIARWASRWFPRHDEQPPRHVAVYDDEGNLVATAGVAEVVD